MKKVIIFAAVLALMASTAAFAGPLVGLSLQPKAGQEANIFFGWQSQNDWAAFISKSNLNTWEGNWGFGAIWTPGLWGNTTNLRAGGDLNFYWTKYGKIQYQGLDLRIGAEKWLTNQLGIWGELRIASNLALYPVVGIDLNFYMPSANEEPTT